ncbi:MAG: HAD family hydrolase [Chloroflexi bacterium]|nr:HAD family hydrolase [Chloroflexota bacterium]
MSSAIKAVLFDVGGPLDTETIMDRMIDEQIVASFRSRGVSVSDDEYGEVVAWAVEVFAPRTYDAIIWKIAGSDQKLADSVFAELYETVPDRNEARGDFELRDGIPELLDNLSQQGLLLGLAANQPSRTIESLDRVGILRYFRYQEVSGSTGLRKPDPRLLLHACEGLGVVPEEAIMVGDRIDNDIVPARMLGMTAIRFVSGRHANQKPRSWAEAPDADVRTVGELQIAFDKLVDEPQQFSSDNLPD